MLCKIFDKGRFHFYISTTIWYDGFRFYLLPNLFYAKEILPVYDGSFNTLIRSVNFMWFVFQISFSWNFKKNNNKNL